LRECHELSVYEAIERLVQAGEAAGFDSDTLLRMLDQGLSFEELLEIIESKMERLQEAALSPAKDETRQRIHCIGRCP